MIIRGDFAKPTSLNRYNYVQSNPIKYSDPSGHRQIEGATVNEKAKSVSTASMAGMPSNIVKSSTGVGYTAKSSSSSSSSRISGTPTLSLPYPVWPKPLGEYYFKCDEEDEEKNNTSIEADKIVEGVGAAFQIVGINTLKNNGLRQTTQAIADGDYYRVYGFYKNQMSGKYLIENLDKYDNLSAVIKSQNLKAAGEVIGVAADVIDLASTGYDEYTKNPDLSQDQKVINTSVEVGIQATSIFAQIGTAAAIGALAGSAIPGAGTLMGAIIGVASVVVTTIACDTIDTSIHSVTHDVTWGDENNSFADKAKDFVYEQYVSYNEWYEEKSKTGEIFSMGTK